MSQVEGQTVQPGCLYSQRRHNGTFVRKSFMWADPCRREVEDKSAIILVNLRSRSSQQHEVYLRVLRHLEPRREIREPEDSWRLEPPIQEWWSYRHQEGYSILTQKLSSLRLALSYQQLLWYMSITSRPVAM